MPEHQRYECFCLKHALSRKIALRMQSNMALVVKRLRQPIQNKYEAVCRVPFSNQCLCLLKRFNRYLLAQGFDLVSAE